MCPMVGHPSMHSQNMQSKQYVVHEKSFDGCFIEVNVAHRALRSAPIANITPKRAFDVEVSPLSLPVHMCVSVGLSAAPPTLK